MSQQQSANEHKAGVHTKPGTSVAHNDTHHSTPHSTTHPHQERVLHPPVMNPQQQNPDALGVGISAGAKGATLAGAAGILSHYALNKFTSYSKLNWRIKFIFVQAFFITGFYVSAEKAINSLKNIENEELPPIYFGKNK